MALTHHREIYKSRLDEIKICYERFGVQITLALFGLSRFTLAEYARDNNWNRPTAADATASIIDVASTQLRESIHK